MSEEKKPIPDALKKFQEDLERDKDWDKQKKELQKKKLLVDDYKYTNELEIITKSKSDISKIDKVNVGVMSDEEIQETMIKNRLYLEGAKNGMLFLNETFRNFIPCWAGNIILVGARTGGGKSSATANLIYSTVKQTNPLTGKNRKVLCISCEETPLQVFNRLTCLVLGYNFNEQDEFTEEQKTQLVEFSGKWPKYGVTVIGDDGHGRTDSIEGIRSIFENLVALKEYYDLILIDYIQKIVTSKKNPKAQQFTVLKDVMNILDYYKNEYPAPIVVMSQLSSQNAGDPENELDFQDRLRGCKDLITPCTVALEMVPDVQNLRTRWYVRKNRYKGSTVNGWKDTAYDRGMFKPMTTAWEKEVSLSKEKKEWAEQVGKHVFDNKEENKE